MLNLLNTITAGSAIFLAFLVVTVQRDANVTANRWLGAFLCCVGLTILDDCLLVYGIYHQNPSLIGLLGILVFALAPLIYLAVSRYISSDRGWRWRDIWHLSPFLLLQLLSLPF